MRAALDIRALDDRGLSEGGIGRYTRCLLDAMCPPSADELVTLRDLRRPPGPARLAEGWEQLLLARDVRRAGADVLHCPSIDGLALRTGAPLVVTVHDLVPLKNRERYLRTGLKHRLRYAAVRRAARVIVPARTVAGDVQRLLGIDAERIEVVPEAAAPRFAPVTDPRKRLGRIDLPERFLLWVGALDPPDPRKGLDGLRAAAAARAGAPIVLAGRASASARRLELQGRVQLVGRVSDDELAALYSAAEALVFPSLDEGYGLPTVEALACGTPVAAYAAGALPEVLDTARGVELVPAGDAIALLEAAERLAGAQAAPPRRTWNEVARETWTVYERAAAQRE